ncbi:hypothetical protein PN36_05410 [Candidatus Thiomargarita nelsonii]|uniref:Ig-like SoxY domain-containing protein n=1 Tax=Candidatus Thiomargarita nelsonii TaxID=1003181 RepID=A0A0A6PBJ6_9GAMM|nr:hypothetical protein PN36_05410 [Candidatus Thiomargarita nelsonii]
MILARRTFLKGIIATGGTMALGTSLLPSSVMADWPKLAFEATSVEDAMMALFDSAEVEETDKITIDTPDIAENGAVVPVEITANLPNVKSITIIAEKNPVPLIGQFDFGENAEGWVKTRIKMGKTSNVIAVVKADGKLYAARREIKVTLGGCGS